MKIIQCQKSYSAAEIKRVGTYLEIVLFLTFLATLAWLFLEKFQGQLDIGVRLALLAFAYFGVGTLYYFLFHKSDHQYYLDTLINNLVGKKGEDMVSSILKNDFGDDCIYLRNYPISNEFKNSGDIDGVLITPKGLFVLEVKFYSGSFEIVNGHFQKIFKDQSRSYPFDKPIWQSNKQHTYITELMNRNNCHPYIRALVVLAHGRILHIKGQTGVYILEKDKLIDFIRQDMARLPNELDQTALRSIMNAFQMAAGVGL